MSRSLLRSVKRRFPEQHPLRLSWHRTKAFIAALCCGFPARRLTIIGITGTDGKTTTVGMTAHILHEIGIATGALSTAFFRVKGAVTWNATQKTSPSPFVVQKFLRRLVREGCTHAVLECSSHGLVQGRVNWTWPSVAAITNTSPEHLDYHGTMEKYRADKSILFQMLKGGGTKVLNAADETCATYLPIPSERTILYSAEKRAGKVPGATYFWLSNIHVKPASTSALLYWNRDGRTWDLHLGIPGAFNVENALCALSCCYGIGVSPDEALEALQSFTGVPGRIERIDEGQPFSVFVDFTVTPASYERTLKTVRDMLTRTQRLLVLAGSCGDRMKEKRPTVGKLCSELADVVVITNEDPYTEDPEKIIDEVWAGVDQSKTQAHRIVDRLEAIKFLFAQAKPGDAVILCGKGSDTTMYTKDGQIPWNEREIARELLRAQAN
jgi:UDP-N-acetylmuramoyl-L-alanyl-D-glutamate--2,6-diaminopimelate ligase